MDGFAYDLLAWGICHCNVYMHTKELMQEMCVCLLDKLKDLWQTHKYMHCIIYIYNAVE